MTHTHESGDGRFLDLPCPMLHCRGHLVKRTNHQDGTTFYGCSEYPHCTMTRHGDDVDEEIAARFYGEYGDPDEPHYGM